jgi:hypothetical protein
MTAHYINQSFRPDWVLIKPWEKIYKAITFFVNIFQPFHNSSNGFSIIQFWTN